MVSVDKWNCVRIHFMFYFILSNVDELLWRCFAPEDCVHTQCFLLARDLWQCF